VTHLRQELGISERRAWRTIGQPRSTRRKARLARDDEAALSAAIIRLAGAYGRYGYRRITAPPRAEESVDKQIAVRMFSGGAAGRAAEKWRLTAPVGATPDNDANN